jgi:serine phosphatase RsbU (regulator of sigma subunit)
MFRKIKFERKVVGLLGAILLFISASAVLVYGSLQQIIDEITEEARPDESLLLMKDMLYDLSDAENSVKSYSLTKNVAYLDQFDSKTVEVDQKIQELRRLSKDDKEHLAYVDSLDFLTKNKFIFLEDLLIIQSKFKVEEILNKVIQNIESVEETITNQETNEDNELKKGFFKRLKEKREKKELEDKNGILENKEESLNQIGAEVDSLRILEKEHEASVRLEELELIQKDKDIMDHIMSIIAHLEIEEHERMEIQLTKANQQSRSIKYVVAAFCVLVTLLLMVAAYVIFSYVKRNNAYKKALRLAKEETENKNKEVMDSIQYAQRIQNAILPDSKKIESCIPNSFILFEPKDIVAGDFYWMMKMNDTVLLAVADCTGHGVPGAMVSVVCHNALNRSVREFGFTNPSKILDKARDLVVETLDAGDMKVSDGMDIALCSINTKTNVIEYAGANNALYLIKNKTIHEVKADKQPVGRYSNSKPFTNHVIQLEKGDHLYLFTDGFADQFGGEHLPNGKPGGKKFKYKPFKELLVKTSENTTVIQKNKIADAFEKWRGSQEQIDDVCIIGVRLD